MKTLPTIAACFIFLIPFMVACKNKQSEKVFTDVPIDTLSKDVVSYFADTLIRRVKSGNSEYDQLGLGGGVDAFVLRKTFPGLKPADFANIVTHHGNYLVKGDTLYFEGNAASNSAMLGIDGMKKLLGNCARRLSVPIRTTKDVDRIINSLLM